MLKLYRNLEFSFFVDFLKSEVFSYRKMPELVMALPIRAVDKMVMLMLMPGFLYALHHPHEEYASWDLKCQHTSGNTSHIIAAIKHRGIDHEEVTKMLEETYKEIEDG